MNVIFVFLILFKKGNDRRTCQLIIKDPFKIEERKKKIRRLKNKQVLDETSLEKKVTWEERVWPERWSLLATDPDLGWSVTLRPHFYDYKNVFILSWCYKVLKMHQHKKVISIHREGMTRYKKIKQTPNSSFFYVCLFNRTKCAKKKMPPSPFARSLSLQEENKVIALFC